MKKIISVFTSLLMAFTCMVGVKAQENNLAVYQNVVNELNQKYEAQAKIFDENEYIVGHYEDVYGMSYEDYIHNILSTDIQTFRDEWVKVMEPNDIISVQVNPMTRSSYGSKTIFFNANANKMTLSYKYSGSTYDMTYKPTVTVEKVLSYRYFEMQTHFGSFITNKKYTVSANGRIITTYGIVNNQTFTVDFNL